MLVLAVERDQRLGELAQIADRRRAPVDERPRAPVGADPPREHDLLGVGGQPLAELAAQRLGQLEDPFDVRLGGARPHDAGLRATAEQQVERMGEHRLAGAGLPRQHVQPGRQPQLGPLDEQEVLDAQFAEHPDGVSARPDGTAVCGGFVTNRRVAPVRVRYDDRRPNFARSRL